MNPLFQTQNPMFNNPHAFGMMNQPIGQPQHGCCPTGYSNFAQGYQQQGPFVNNLPGQTIDPIFSNVVPQTVRPAFLNNTGWTSTFNTTPWNTTFPTWNGFYPTNTFNTQNWNGWQNTWPTAAWQNTPWQSTMFANMTNPYHAFPMAGVCPITGVARTNMGTYTNFMNGMQSPFNAFNAMAQWNGILPQTTPFTTPFNTTPFNTTPFNTTPFNFMPINTIPMSFAPGFWPTNFAPTNFIPMNYVPTSYLATNFTQPTNVPQNYTQQQGYPTNTQPTNTYPQQTNPYAQPTNGYPQQAGYAYPAYAGVSPVSVPTSMDPSEKSNKRTMMSRES